MSGVSWLECWPERLETTESGRLNNVPGLQPRSVTTFTEPPLNLKLGCASGWCAAAEGSAATYLIKLRYAF